MSLLEPRDYYKPFRYDWAYKAYEMQQAMHWLPHEAPLAEDVNDWARKLTSNEQSLLNQLFRFFTQADVDVARGYFEKYGPRFPHPEVRMMLAAFMAAEANHIDSYAKLIETLGLPELEFKAFMNYEAMREKHEYMFERGNGKSIADLAVDLAVFSAFGEGMQLFSSFAILMSFQRRGLMKGMTTIVEWSIRDESLHVESMIKLFHTLIQEHPRVWNDETKKRIYDACRDMVRLEDAFIDQAFSLGEVDGITKQETKKYIRYIADRRLLQLCLKPHYKVKENPFDWLDWIMNAPTHTNFFEGRSTEYSKGETPGWDKAFDFLDKRKVAQILECSEDGVCAVPVAAAPAQFLIYTKPGCPYCEKAEEYLTSKSIPFNSVQLIDADQRQNMFDQVNSVWGRSGWKTSPMIFTLDQKQNPTAFVGGYNDLLAHLA